MNKFVPGDKVKCIDADYVTKYIAVNGIYTIECYHPDTTLYPTNVRLKEVPNGGWWLEDRFELISSYSSTCSTSPSECKCGIYRNDCVYHKD
jgi:hypothetical protein